MSLEVLTVVPAAAIACIVAFPLGKCLRKRPAAFYVVAFVATAAYVWTVAVGYNPKGLRWLTFMF